MSLEAHARRVVFSDHVGGNVSIENEGRGALHYSSYGTSKTEQTFSEGLHYVECLIDYKSHYCGVGCLSNETPLPEAGRGAWLSPSGAIMWVSGSGLWGSTHHRRNSSLSFDSGDYVGVLLSLQENERKVYWYLNGAYTGNFLDLKEETRDCGPLSICYCIG